MGESKCSSVINALDSKWGKRCLWAAYALALFSLSYSYGLNRIVHLDYVYLNGDFQSYNVFRRMLNGQVPYRDFANYIGMGPVFLCMPFLWLWQGFPASLFITNFVCNLLFSLSILVLFWLITENLPLSMLVSACFSKLVSSGLLSLLVGPRFSNYFDSVFTDLYTPSNSMRMARVSLPFLLVLGFLVFAKLYRLRKRRPYNLVQGPQSLVFCTVLGLPAGLGVVWSNDYGLAVAVSAGLVLSVLLFYGRFCLKGFLARLGLYLAGFFVGALAAISAVTHGRPGDYLTSFFSVGKYQYFYFNGMGGKAIFAYIFSNVRLLAFTLVVLVGLCFCLVRLLRGRAASREVLLAFLGLTILVATYAYIASGSGYNFWEALEGYTWLALLAVLLRALLFCVKKAPLGRTLAHTAPAILMAPVMLFMLGNAITDGANRTAYVPQTVYEERFGGCLPYPIALEEAALRTGEEEVFSLYASGLELVKNQFQPSGYDYIIHALGDEARENYVACFVEGRYTFVQTLRNTDMEQWLCTHHWSLYKLIWQNYVPVMETEYSVLWERSEKEPLQAQAQLKVENNGNSWTIHVYSNSPDDFTADILVSYGSTFKSLWGGLVSMGRSYVSFNTQDLYGKGTNAWANIPASAEEWNVPVAVRNGYGSVNFFAMDGQYAHISFLNAQYLGAYPDMAVK